MSDSPTLNLPADRPATPGANSVVARYESNAIEDPFDELPQKHKEEIQTQWDNLKQNNCVSFEILDLQQQNEKEERIASFKQNAKKKMERHPSKATLVTSLLNNSRNTLERRQKLQQTRLKRFLKIVRKKNSGDEDELDSMDEHEFKIVMALRMLERDDDNKMPRSPRFGQKAEAQMKKTRQSIEMLNSYVNSPKKASS